MSIAQPLTSKPATIGGEAAIAEMREIQRQRRASRIRFGFPQLDKILQPRPGQLMILAGKVSTFKTTLAWNMALNLRLLGLRVCWLGLEQPPGEMAELALSRFSQVPTRKIREGSLMLPDMAAIEKAEAQFATVCPILHNGNSSLHSIMQTVNRIRYDVVILDYLQRVDAPGDEYGKTSLVSKTLATLSGKGPEGRRDYTPMVIALSQFNRQGGRAQMEDDRFPDITDLKGSSQIEQDADIILFLHRQKSQTREDPKVYLKVAKNRGGPKEMVLTLRAQPEIAFIEEYEEEIEPERERYP
jgi:replicative DNA helicase